MPIYSLFTYHEQGRLKKRLHCGPASPFPLAPVIERGQLLMITAYFKNFPEKTVLEPHELKGLIHTAYQLEKSIIIEGARIGNGNHGEVYIGSLYKKTELAKLCQQQLLSSEPCVIKKIRQNTISRVRNFLFSTVNTEETINNHIFGSSATLTIDNNMTVIIMPYLGDMTLGKLLTSPKMMEHIPLIEWMKIFILLAKQLKLVHLRTSFLHNDIKPDNILLTFFKDARGIEIHPLKIQSVNLADWGNAHKAKTLQMPGDIRYSHWACFLPIKELRDEKIDSYSLGKTFLQVIDTLPLHIFKLYELPFINRCRLLFEKMADKSRSEIPELGWMNKPFVVNTDDGIIHQLSVFESELRSLNNGLTQKDPKITFPLCL